MKNWNHKPWSKKKGLCFCKSLDEEWTESDSSCPIIGPLITTAAEYLLYI